MTQPEATTNAPASVKLRRLRQTASIGSVVMLVAVSLCLVTQPGWLAPVILVPTWCWLVCGVMLACCGLHTDRKQWFVGLLLAWAAFAWLFVEEVHSLIRRESVSSSEWLAARESGRGIRIVSLNCNVGQSRCVEEVVAWKPDVVLLQESPSKEQLPGLVELLFGQDGSCLYGGDVSILARGKLTRRFSDAFLTAGSGWGATGTNEYPLFRVDQVWVSNSLQPVSVMAKKTLHSDHQMVVCDLVIGD